MESIKKASLEAATSEQDASEINQVQDNPDFGNCQEPVDPMLVEMAELAYKMTALYKSHGVISINGVNEQYVQMKEDSFFELFSFGECTEDYLSRKAGHGSDSDKYSTTVCGVEFFCLVEKEVSDGKDTLEKAE